MFVWDRPFAFNSSWVPLTGSPAVPEEDEDQSEDNDNSSFVSDKVNGGFMFYLFTLMVIRPKQVSSFTHSLVWQKLLCKVQLLHKHFTLNTICFVMLMCLNYVSMVLFSNTFSVLGHKNDQYHKMV